MCVVRFSTRDKEDAVRTLSAHQACQNTHGRQRSGDLAQGDAGAREVQRRRLTHSSIAPIGLLASKPVLEGEIRLMIHETQASFASGMSIQETMTSAR